MQKTKQEALLLHSLHDQYKQFRTIEMNLSLSATHSIKVVHNGWCQYGLVGRRVEGFCRFCFDRSRLVTAVFGLTLRVHASGETEQVGHANGHWRRP